jgi:hypothetical protein
MSKFRCTCGNVMVDHTMEEPHLLDVFQTSHSVNIGANLTEDSVAAYQQKLAKSGCELSIIECVHDMVFGELMSQKRSAYLCGECGRFWLQDLEHVDAEGYRNKFVSYVEEAKLSQT